MLWCVVSYGSRFCGNIITYNKKFIAEIDIFTTSIDNLYNVKKVESVDYAI